MASPGIALAAGYGLVDQVPGTARTSGTMSEDPQSSKRCNLG
jgi:hypothetical protein